MTEEVEELVNKKFVDRYLRHEVLGQGTYGVVYKATDTETGETVAIKKIRLGKEKEGVNFTALREIKLLKELNHYNIIKLTNTFPNKANLHLVFEYMESDLEAVIRDTNIVLSPADIKSYLQMTLKGLAFCHKNWILHRDVKPNNLLIGNKGQLKIGDFGLARIFGSPKQQLTHQVFSRWYRAPELLFGAKGYGASVDIWAVACVFAELVLRRPFLQGNSDIDQIGKIYAAFGTPTQKQWPDMLCLPDYVAFEYVPAPPLRSLFPAVSEDALELLSKMFTYDPKRRISAQQALEHRYFSSVPPPTEPVFLPKPGPRKDLDDGYFNQVKSPTVLSPRRKSRRVMVQQDDEMECGGQTVKPTAVDFSIFAKGPAVRPTITSADKRSLKRKLDLEFDLAEFDH